MRVHSIAMAVLLISPQIVLAEGDCRADLPASTPDSDFQIRDDATVTHLPTGLTWMRCALGQTWSDGQCQGHGARYYWPNALQVASNYSYAGFDDWRVPSKNELLSIVEYRCFDPALNRQVFPGAASVDLWTSSTSVASSWMVWSVHFFSGAGNLASKSHVLREVRLVRGGDPIAQE